MSNTLTINDTYTAVQRLKAKGANDALAEEIVAVVQSAKLESDPATRADVSELRAEMYRAFIIHGFIVVASVVGTAITLAAILRQS